jgi:uroporphyrinogen decarboxylase
MGEKVYGLVLFRYRRSVKPLLSVLRGEKPLRLPVWLMRQAGRYLPEYRALRAQAPDFLAFCFTPELATEATLQPLRRFDLDGAIVFSDILVLPLALGQEVAFQDGPVLGPLDISALLYQPVKLQPVYDTLAGVKARLAPEVTLLGFAGAPWTLARYMCGDPKRWIAERPADFARLIDILCLTVADHLIAQIHAGADAVQIFDSWAGELAMSDLITYSVKPLADIITRVKKECPGVPVIVFPRGVGGAYRDYLGLGADCLSLDAAVPLDWAKRQLLPAIALQGNLAPEKLREGGEALAHQTRMIRAAFSEGRHIFNLGHGVLPETPPEHVEALLDVLRA